METLIAPRIGGAFHVPRALRVSQKAGRAYCSSISCLIDFDEIGKVLRKGTLIDER